MRQVIQRVGPAAVVVELDEGRYKKLREAAERGDAFGLQPSKASSSWEVGWWVGGRVCRAGAILPHSGYPPPLQIVKMSLSGQVLPYAMGLVYVITGAVMGSRPGGEFLAAAEAADAAGARLVLGDRDQAITMQRLQYYTHHLTRQDSRRIEDGRRLRGMMEQQGGGGEAGGAAPLGGDAGEPLGQWGRVGRHGVE